MKTIFEHAGTGKEVLARFAKEQKRKRKAGDPGTAALKAISTSLAAAAPGDRVQVTIAIAEHDLEPLFKADLSITSPPAARTA